MSERYSANLGSLSINGPFTIPSGIVTTVPEVLARLARDIPSLGFLTTKTISLEPRSGYREPVIHEYHPGCFVNAVGLANPGAQAFLESMKPLKPLYENKPLVVSIMGVDPEEFLQCAKILEPIADAFELNLSCPHVKGAGQAIGSDPEMVKAIIGSIRQMVKRPLIPKLSPNLSNFHEIVALCEREGADGLSLINTVGPGTAVDLDGVPVLSNINGGLSGSAIKPLGLKLVREASAIIKVPIVASGGISTPEDIAAYRKAGASLFGIGSSLAMVRTDRMPAVFDWLETGLKSKPEPSSIPELIPVKRRTDYFKANVSSNLPLAPNMFELTLDLEVDCEPGQFFFIRIPGVGEKPFSPVDSRPLTFYVRAVGIFTRALETLRPNDAVQLRGPYGNGFPSDICHAPLLMLGGGTGAGPIIMAARKWEIHNPMVYLGFSFDIEIDTKDICSRAHVAIDPPGRPGEVIRILKKAINENSDAFLNATVFLCGPRAMMEAGATVMAQLTNSGNIYMAREDVMKCGIGVCGSCGSPSGLRSCVDGPVIALESLRS